MKKIIPYILLIYILFHTNFTSPVRSSENDDVASHRKVLVIGVEGAINALTVEYIQRGITDAEEGNYECLIIELDTPGGLLESTRQISKAILASEVPIVVYVSPVVQEPPLLVFLLLMLHISQ